MYRQTCSGNTRIDYFDSGSSKTFACETAGRRILILSKYARVMPPRSGKRIAKMIFRQVHQMNICMRLRLTELILILLT